MIVRLCWRASRAEGGHVGTSPPVIVELRIWAARKDIERFGMGSPQRDFVTLGRHGASSAVRRNYNSPQIAAELHCGTDPRALPAPLS